MVLRAPRPNDNRILSEQFPFKIRIKKHQFLDHNYKIIVVTRNQLPRPCTWLIWQSKHTGHEGEHNIIRCILVCCPCLSCGEVGCARVVVLRVGGQWHRLACWGKLGFFCWYVKRSSVVRQVDGWILEESQMSLAVTPRTGNSHEVGGEFPDDHIYLFGCRENIG